MRVGVLRVLPLLCVAVEEILAQPVARLVMRGHHRRVDVRRDPAESLGRPA